MSRVFIILFKIFESLFSKAFITVKFRLICLHLYVKSFNVLLFYYFTIILLAYLVKTLNSYLFFQSANWSIARLSKWLDQHKSEKERLELLNGALQKYQQTIRSQNQASFHSVYPIMMQILEQGFQYISQPPP